MLAWPDWKRRAAVEIDGCESGKTWETPARSHGDSLSKNSGEFRFTSVDARVSLNTGSLQSAQVATAKVGAERLDQGQDGGGFCAFDRFSEFPSTLR